MLRLLLLIIIPILSLSQNTAKAVIINKLTGKPVEYALIFNMNSNKYVLSEVNGEFTIKVSPKDSILVSCLGYYDKLLLGNDLINKDTIYLLESAITLPYVDIISRYNYSGEEKTIGYLNYKTESYSLLIYREKHVRLGIFVANPESYPLLIKGISAKLVKGEPCDLLVKLCLMSVDSSCKCPGVVLWHKYYKFDDFRDDFYVSVLPDTVLLPKDGIFIVFEVLHYGEDCGFNNKNIYFRDYISYKYPVYMVSINGRKWGYLRNAFRKRKKNRVPLIGLQVIYPEF